MKGFGMLYKHGDYFELRKGIQAENREEALSLAQQFLSHLRIVIDSSVVHEEAYKDGRGCGYKVKFSVSPSYKSEFYESENELTISDGYELNENMLKEVRDEESQRDYIIMPMPTDGDD